MSIYDDLRAKIKTLDETVWDGHASGTKLNEWLENFKKDGVGGGPSERLHALFLLGQFMYFGNREMRVLLRSLYQDIYKYPIIERIRRANRDTLDTRLIVDEFKKELRRSRFLGVGNPSESGCHLLYYFRQENELPKNMFVHAHELFENAGAGVRLMEPDTLSYVFIDDFCGSGSQAIVYSRKIVAQIKALNKKCRVEYYSLFGTKAGIDNAKKSTAFDRVESLLELDNTFKCFGDESRYFLNAPIGIKKRFAKEMCQRYGSTLEPGHPLGFGGCELLIGFAHNTPDNALPIIWKDSEIPPWTAMFRRYHKNYGWGAK